MNNANIIMLASDGLSTRILYNAVNDQFPITHVILEDDVKTSRFLKQRYKKVGLLRIIDQMFFILTLNKLLAVLSRKRKASILKEKKLKEHFISENKITRVTSANARETIQLIKEMAPDIILINGTRILSKKLLTSTTATILNLHAGITPDYRGVHGAYWAYVNKDPHMAGVTLHYVDSGVDTGNIIGQASIKTNFSDNFSTYPLLQLSEGIALLKNFLNDYVVGQKADPLILSKNAVSRQWYHPGFFEYLYHRLFHGVK